MRAYGASDDWWNGAELRCWKTAIWGGQKRAVPVGGLNSTTIYISLCENHDRDVSRKTERLSRDFRVRVDVGFRFMEIGFKANVTDS